MRHKSCKAIKLGFIKQFFGMGFNGHEIKLKFAEMLQDGNQRCLSFIKNINEVLALGLNSVLSSTQRLDDDGANDANDAAYENALQSFSQYALSSLQPGGGKLCQEAPRLALIIRQIFCTFNVNLRGNFAGGMTA